MFAFVRDLAGTWADNRFVRANRVLRRRNSLLEAANERLSGSLERTRARRAIDRDFRVAAEFQVAQLTRANLALSGLVSEVLARKEVPPQPDPLAVSEALEARGNAADAFVSALEESLRADADYRNAYNAKYIDESGPEHVRKAVAEEASAELRGARDAAEVAKVAAEQSVRLAELGFRAAMAGAVADEAGERP